MLSRAFLHDPAWVAIGPAPAAHRRVVENAFHWGELAAARHHGASARGAFRAGELCGVALAEAAGHRRPGPLGRIYSVPGFILAGPLPGLRAARLDAVFERHHPREPHVYLHYLAADPAHQRTGVGGRLLGAVIADADAAGAPVYLETTRPENVVYYRGFGFEVIGEDALARGARAWFMWRGAPA